MLERGGRVARGRGARRGSQAARSLGHGARGGVAIAVVDGCLQASIRTRDHVGPPIWLAHLQDRFPQRGTPCPSASPQDVDIARLALDSRGCTEPRS